MSRKLPRTIALTLLMILLLTPVFGQGGAEKSDKSEITTIKMSTWLATEGASRDTMMYMIEEFEKANPTVKVEMINIPYDQTPQQMTVAATSRTLPDVIHLNPMFSSPLASMGVLAELSSFYTEEELQEIPEAARNAGMFDNELLTVPWQIAPIVVLANKEVLTKAGLPLEIPKDWDAFFDAVEQISELGDEYYGIAARTATGSNTGFWFFPVLWGTGGSFEEDGKIVFDSTETRKAFDFYRELGLKKMSPSGMSIPETRNLFAQNRVGFIFDGPWMKGIIRSASGLGEDADDMYIVGEFPEAKDGKRYGIGNNHVLAVSQTSKNKEASVELIKFLTQDPEITKYYYNKMGAIPTYASLLEDPLYAEDPFIEPFIRAAEYSDNLPSTNPQLGGALEEISIGLQEVMLGADPAVVVPKVENAIVEIFEQ
jgi:ABC-type glycerol-3-phosphate transport system substrate-binding protein